MPRPLLSSDVPKDCYRTLNIFPDHLDRSSTTINYYLVYRPCKEMVSLCSLNAGPRELSDYGPMK